MGFGGFLKGLGKGILKVAPIAASFIPGVGGAVGALSKTGKILRGAANLAPVLGGAAKSANSSQTVQNSEQLQRDKLAMEKFKLGLEAPGTRLNQSIAASKTKNFTPVTSHWGGPGSGMRGDHTTFSGGYANPDMISPETKAQADDILHQNLTSQLQHGADLPTVTPAGKSKVGGVLGAGALGASILGAFKKPGEVPPVPELQPMTDRPPVNPDEDYQFG